MFGFVILVYFGYTGVRRPRLGHVERLRSGAARSSRR